MSGYDVHTRYDGASAVDAAEELQPNVVILDLAMPVMNGYDACKKIRQQPWSDGMAIVALTGWGPESGMRDAEAHGFDALVVKPAKVEKLEQLLADLIQASPKHPT
jgi:CheY-like chemotaxis protein